MVNLYLPEHIRFCEIGNRRIFLDLKADRYFSLPPDADAAISAMCEGAAVEISSELASLLDAGLLTRSPGRVIAPTEHPEPTISLVEEASVSGNLSVSTLVEVSLLVLRARRAVRKKRLPSLLAPSGPGQSEARSSPEARDRAVGDFIQCRRAVPIAPNCLYDSLALRRFLERRSVAADLVIGAKVHPFAAHCWVQDGTIVLNDTLAAARGFAPILVA